MNLIRFFGRSDRGLVVMPTNITLKRKRKIRKKSFIQNTENVKDQATCDSG